QMKTSAPRASAAAAATSANEGVASGDDAFRPTSFLGLERAQVLANGNALMGLGGLNLALGMGNNVEVGGNLGLNLAVSPFSLGIPVGVYGKMLLPVNFLPNMTVALGANVGATLASTGTGFSAGVFLPLSFWRLGPGNLHVVPMIGSTAGLGLGYELPVTSKWTLHIANSTGMALGGAGTVTNALTLGNRVALTPNLTADVGSISLSGTNLSVNLFSIGGTFGGRLADVRSAWGL
ncbi:MAG TPA: hypothetical protein V6D05_09315, partial [Stenomitos sp.]